MIVIGLCGIQGAGKTLVARYLEQRHSFCRAELDSPRMIEFEEVARRLNLLDAYSKPGAVIDAVHGNQQADAIRYAGGQIWHVVYPRRNTPAGIGILPHGRDRGVLNTGELEPLHQRVDQLLQQLEATIS